MSDDLKRVNEVGESIPVIGGDESVVDDSDLYAIVGEEIVEKKEIARKQKTKKVRKKMSKYVAIPIILFLLISTFLAVETNSFTAMISFFQDLFFGTSNGQVVASDVGDYSVDIQNVNNRESVDKGELTSVNDKEEQARLDALAENSRVYCIISSSPYFSSVEDKGSLYISNPPESTFYTQVVIVTQEDEKEMYVSDVLAPNEKVEYDYLSDKSFKKGSYKCNALFNYYNKESNSETGKDEYIYVGTLVAEVVMVVDEVSKK